MNWTKLAPALPFLASACIASAIAAPEAKKEDHHVYLLIGQSNMAGRAPFTKEEAGEIERGFLLDSEDQWEPAKNPLNRHSTIRKGLGMQKMNPGFMFAKAILEKDQDITLGLVVNAKGGSSIRQWVKGGRFYGEAIRRTRSAQKTGTLKGILWHQGESDKDDADYLPKLRTLIGNLRKDLGQPKLPFVAGQIKDVPLINDQLVELPATVPDTATASSLGLTTMDRWHFDAASMRELGTRFANAMDELQHNRAEADRLPKDDAPNNHTNEDWPQWMGADREGIWQERGILEKFPHGGPEVMWRTPINHGYSGPAVVGERVYVMDRKLSDPAKSPDSPFERGEIPGNERVLCLSATDGKIIWEHAYDCQYTVSYASGPRTTPTVDGDRVYTVGAEGDLLCLSASDGELRWKHNFKQLFGIKAPTWGFTSAPLVDGNLLICLAGGNGSTAVAFDKLTGEQKWSNLSTKEPGYAPPKIITHSGRRLLIIWHPQSVNALDPQSGEIHWAVDWPLRSGLSISTPRLHGDLLFLSCFYNGSMMLKLQDDHSVPEILWRTEKASENPARTEHLNGIMSTPVLVGGHIYGVCSYGEFRCLEAISGERLWDTLKPIALDRPTRWGNAFITPQAERFFLFTEKGDLVIANLSPEGYEEIDRAHLIGPDGVDLRQRKVVWSHPAYARRCCFVRNDSEIICVSLAE